jgi:DNA-binding PadR family transcriptional regulator
MEKAPVPQTPMPLTPAVFHILLVLSDGEKHGYGIMQEVAALTDGALRLGPGTLYGTIKRLLVAGLVEEVDERVDRVLGDERRRYYRLTESGNTVVRAEAHRLESLVGAARRKHLLAPVDTGVQVFGIPVFSSSLIRTDGIRPEGGA